MILTPRPIGRGVDFLRTTVAEDIRGDGGFWGNAGAFLYQTGMSIGDSMVNNAAFGSTLGNLVLGGGLETLPGKLGTSGGSTLGKWGISALQEGLEEPVQSSYENLVAKALYDHDLPWYSTTDPNAVFNPIRAGSEFALGTAVGGILGGVQTGISGTADPDSQIDDLKRQLEAVRYENDLAELKAEYDKHVPLPDYTSIPTIASKTESSVPDAKQQLNESKKNILKGKTDSGELLKSISFQMQSKHIEGTPQYEQYKNARLQKGDNPQSILTISREDAQELVDRYSGTGNISITPSGQNTIKIVEYVTADKVVGKYFADDKFVDTKRFGIYYGKRGAHVVPVKEDYND